VLLSELLDAKAVVLEVEVEFVSDACAVIIAKPPMTAANAVIISRVNAAVFLSIFPPPFHLKSLCPKRY